MGSITPLVINSLAGGHTHARTHTDIRGQKRFQETPGLKMTHVRVHFHGNLVFFSFNCFCLRKGLVGQLRSNIADTGVELIAHY